jgi:release factor glutamine methyltransferase
MRSHPEQSLDFGGLRIAFDDRVLRPRPWTTAQSMWAARLLLEAPPGPVLELCAGAGQIGLLVAARTGRRLVAVDVDPAACGLNRRNAQAAGLDDLVEVRQGRIEDAVRPGERFALVVADPPWVRREETCRHPEDPLLAIDGGPDGLDVAWACLDAAREHLLPGGSLVLQVGTIAQAERVRRRLVPGDGLVVTATSQEERGVLVRVDRRSGHLEPAGA